MATPALRRGPRHRFAQDDQGSWWLEARPARSRVLAAQVEPAGDAARLTLEVPRKLAHALAQVRTPSRTERDAARRSFADLLKQWSSRRPRAGPQVMHMHLRPGYRLESTYDGQMPPEVIVRPRAPRV